MVLVLQESAQVLLGRPVPAHGVGEGPPGALAGAAHTSNLGGRLDSPLRIDPWSQGCRTESRRGGGQGIPKLGRDAVLGQLGVSVDLLYALQRIGEFLVQPPNVSDLVGVPYVSCRVYAAPGPVPLLLFGILWPAPKIEYEVALLRASLDDQRQRVGFAEAGEVEKVALLAEGMENGAGSVLHLGRGQKDCRACREGGEEFGSSLMVLLRCDTRRELPGCEEMGVRLVDRLAE